MHFFCPRILIALCLLLALQGVRAAEPVAPQPAMSAQDKISTLIDKGFGFLGVRYRMGGNGPDAGGFDCSGLVRKVFGDALGLNLPRTAAEMARLGDKVGTQDLKPGDLVFFNTMRRTFSHVGIYLGDNKFLHSPARGSAVRVEDMDQSYWMKRFNGGRRLVSEAQAAPFTPPPLLALPQQADTAPQ
ncbi:MAG: putative lipoprotein precursor [Proteobacteria bacterium]|nr:putative lipoprotein precursor [Pseudomonadota bacterium]